MSSTATATTMTYDDNSLVGEDLGSDATEQHGELEVESRTGVFLRDERTAVQQ
jgi:hypothetical protein